MGFRAVGVLAYGKAEIDFGDGASWQQTIEPAGARSSALRLTVARSALTRWSETIEQRPAVTGRKTTGRGRSLTFFEEVLAPP